MTAADVVRIITAEIDRHKAAGNAATARGDHAGAVASINRLCGLKELVDAIRREHAARTRDLITELARLS